MAVILHKETCTVKQCEHLSLQSKVGKNYYRCQSLVFLKQIIFIPITLNTQRKITSK